LESPLRQVKQEKGEEGRENQERSKKNGKEHKEVLHATDLLTTLIIIMMAFNQGTKEISVNAYTRCAPKLQQGQVIFKRIGDTRYRLEYPNIAFDLDTHLAELAVTPSSA
jgi:hypothetical protein